MKPCLSKKLNHFGAIQQDMLFAVRGWIFVILRNRGNNLFSKIFLYLKWMVLMSYTNFHVSFIETDSIGCGTQLNRKVPPDENNFSWARLSLLRRLRPLENKPGRLRPLSVSRPTLLDLIWNTVLIHFLNRPHVYLFCAGLIRISKKKRCQPIGKP